MASAYRAQLAEQRLQRRRPESAGPVESETKRPLQPSSWQLEQPCQSKLGPLHVVGSPREQPRRQERIPQIAIFEPFRVLLKVLGVGQSSANTSIGSRGSDGMRRTRALKIGE
ncbi:hypothetical protein HG531_000507 [Fusarium graminearum]|nr:hypothetical protein HG531_000507 [Fusarium graminearum]